MRTVMYNHTYR